MATALDGGIMFMPKGDWGTIAFTESVAQRWMRTEATTLKLTGADYQIWCDNNTSSGFGIDNLVHDEINSDGLEEAARDAATELARCMDENFGFFIKTIPVSEGGSIDGNIVNSWSEKL
jgi:hypothetical protein